MTTREEIIALAHECGFGNADVCEGLFYPNFERFFHAAQRQAYERAAYTVFEMAQQSEYALNWIPLHKAQEAIRALIKGETNGAV